MLVQHGQPMPQLLRIPGVLNQQIQPGLTYRRQDRRFLRLEIQLTPAPAATRP